MRTGAIFARGSCRALRWMALVGMAFALGAGSALAQVTVTVPPMVSEGGRLTIGVSVTVRVANGASATSIDLEVRPGPPATTPVAPGETAGDASDLVNGFNTTTVMLDVPPNMTGAAVTRILRDEIVLQTIPDSNAESEVLDLAFTLTARSQVAADGTALVLPPDTTPKTITINDIDPQTYKVELWSVSPAAKVTEVLEDATFEVRLIPDPVRTAALSYSVKIEGAMVAGSSTSAGEVDANAITQRMRTSITLVQDTDRDDGMATVTVLGGTLSNPVTFATVTLPVKDLHKLPMIEARWTNMSGTPTVPPPTEAMEGEKLYLKLYAVERDALGRVVAATLNETLQVSLSPNPSSLASPSDYTLSAASIPISRVAADSAVVTLTLVADADTAAELLGLRRDSDGRSCERCRRREE